MSKLDFNTLLKSVQRNESPAYRLISVPEIWAQYDLWTCVLCGVKCLWSGLGGAREWVHRDTKSRWCARDKQHGPKTRVCHPVPGLLVINELEEP